MATFHTYLGLATAALFLLLFLWAVVAWIRNRHPASAFWNTLMIAQVGLGVLAVTGIVLFALESRQPWLHYAYGGFPILLVIFAHRISARFEGLEWAVFGIAGLVNFGLLTRGFMTGLGM